MSLNLSSSYSSRGLPQCILSSFTSHFSVHFHWKLWSTDRSSSRFRHPVRCLPPPPGRSIPRRQAGIRQFCGAKELAKGHELSLLRRGNLCVARASSQRAARAAAPRFRAPPIFLPFFCECALPLLLCQFIRKISNSLSHVQETSFVCIRP